VNPITDLRIAKNLASNEGHSPSKKGA
jgi:hypothetical protein